MPDLNFLRRIIAWGTISPDYLSHKICVCLATKPDNILTYRAISKEQFLQNKTESCQLSPFRSCYLLVNNSHVLYESVASRNEKKARNNLSIELEIPEDQILIQQIHVDNSLDANTTTFAIIKKAYLQKIVTAINEHGSDPCSIITLAEVMLHIITQTNKAIPPSFIWGHVHGRNLLYIIWDENHGGIYQSIIFNDKDIIKSIQKTWCSICHKSDGMPETIITFENPDQGVNFYKEQKDNHFNIHHPSSIFGDTIFDLDTFWTLAIYDLVKKQTWRSLLAKNMREQCGTSSVSIASTLQYILMGCRVGLLYGALCSASMFMLTFGLLIYNTPDSVPPYAYLYKSERIADMSKQLARNNLVLQNITQNKEAAPGLYELCLYIQNQSHQLLQNNSFEILSLTFTNRYSPLQREPVGHQDIVLEANVQNQKTLHEVEKLITAYSHFNNTTSIKTTWLSKHKVRIVFSLKSNYNSTND